MASFYEKIGSGDGDTFGLSGGSATKTFVSIVGAYTDDPIEQVRTAHPYGQVHPKRSGLGVSDYAQRTTENNLVFDVDVIYSPPFLTGYDDWLWTMEIASESEHITRSEGRQPGDPDTGPNAVAEEGRLIGPHFYVKPNANGEPTATHEVDSLTGLEPIQLAQTTAIKVVGFDRLGAGTTFVGTKTVKSLPTSHVSQVTGFRRTINSVPFRGLASGSVLFVGASIAERLGLGEEGQLRRTNPRPPGGPRGGGEVVKVQPHLAYNLRLSFRYRGDGLSWTPVEIVDTYTDERGFESPLRILNPGSGGEAVIESTWFNVYKRRDLQGLMDMFN